MTVHCKACNHEWNIDMPSSLFLHAIRAMKTAAVDGCPVCGATGTSVLIGAARMEREVNLLKNHRRSSREKERAS